MVFVIKNKKIKCVCYFGVFGWIFYFFGVICKLGKNYLFVCELYDFGIKFD